MALDLSPELRQAGKDNFHRTVGREGTRRDFLKGLLAAGAAVPITAGAYYGYQKLGGKPIKTGLIGAGDEGGVLVGEHNPEFLEFVAYSDIRPYNQKRIFDGEPTGPRKGFKKIYGKDAQKNIKLYEDYKKLLEDKEIEAVVIALPLHLHAQASIDAMRAGKHVLCEKLMAWNITQCKEMIRVAEETDRILAIGHQRHYNLLYAQALEVIESGELGDIHHIRALWHRHNGRPKLDKDGKVIRDPKTGAVEYRDGWKPDLKPEDVEALQARIRQLGYKNMEELCRWRLYNRTGGGLMAELGSHQLDACSIFLGKVHPLAVSGIGGKYLYRDDREVDDHVFATFEFPGRNYAKDKKDVVVMTYSSINTNSFEPYGECVMGTKGTMLVEMEQTVMLYPDTATTRSTAMSVSTAGGGKPAVDGSGSPSAQQLATGQKSLGDGPVSRGYREEMEDFAYCIKRWGEEPKDKRRQPRCHGKVAMADAIVALTSNLAMKHQKRIEFKPEWFDPKNAAVPDAEMKPEIIA